MLAPRSARAEQVFTIGLIPPDDAEAATELVRGAGLGLDDANALAVLFGKRLRLETAPADGAAAVQVGRALARAGALAVVGGAGSGAGEALRDIAADGVVMLNVGASEDRLRNERCERRAFHVIPSVSMYVDGLAQVLIERRQLARWALVTDGSPRAAEIETAARRSVARRGGSVVADVAGADVLLLAVQEGATRAAVARAGADGRRPDRIAGVGDAGLRIPAELAAGLWAVGWHYGLERFSARELNGRFRRRFGAALGETSWAAWAALKLLGEAIVRGGAADGPAVVAFLESGPPFDGHKGEALTFRKWDHQLRQPLYVVGPRKREEVGGRSGPFTVMADVGAGNLDALGTTMAESGCRFGP